MPKKKTTDITIRSSMAEYLTFIAATGDSEHSMEMRYESENIWLTQKMMSALYDVEVNTINYHIKKIFDDSELKEEATIRNFRIVQTEGSRQVSRAIEHYNLQMIIAVGFKVNNDRAVQFRKWAGQIVKDYTIQGWTMDTERLKKGHMFTDEYFERQLQQIREIRLPERKFYQKVTDIYATAFDYDDEEMNYLERIVSVYLDFAELQTARKIPMSMEDWAKRLDGFLEFNGNEILTGAGKISHEQAKLHAETEHEKYRIVQDALFQSDFDRFVADVNRIENGD